MYCFGALYIYCFGMLQVISRFQQIKGGYSLNCNRLYYKEIPLTIKTHSGIPMSDSRYSCQIQKQNHFPYNHPDIQGIHI